MKGLTPQAVVQISASTGSFSGKLAHRTYRIELHQAFSAPTSVSQNGIPLNDGLSVDSLLLGFQGYAYDSLANRLTIQFSGSTESAYTILAVGVPTTSVSTHFSIPMSFSLDQNFPNPFNPTTTLRFGLPRRSKVKLQVFNVLGQLVKVIVNGEMNAGFYEKQWNASVASGIYFCRMEAVSVENPESRFVDSKKMILLK